MKVVVIPDVHGKSTWKEAFHIEADLFVFLGDYVDSFDTKGEDILSNLEEILFIKKTMPDKVVLLLGNHDIGYMYHPFFRCSGFRPEMLDSLKIIFNENQDEFKVAHQIGNHLFTHAGVSRNWFKKWGKILEEYQEYGNLAEVFNILNQTHLRDILHEVGARRGGDRYDHGGITWADKMETYDNLIPNYVQIVGHSKVSEIKTYEFNNNSKIYYTDCLDKKVEFLTLEI